MIPGDLFASRVLYFEDHVLLKMQSLYQGALVSSSLRISLNSEATKDIDHALMAGAPIGQEAR